MFDRARRISIFLVLRGLLTLAFGVLVMALPPAVVVDALLLVFGIFAIVDGSIAFVGAIVSHDTFEDWWLILLIGLLGIMIGIFTLTRPGMVAMVLVLYIGLRALIAGVLEIAFAFRLRKQIQGEWLFIASGILSVLFGAALIFWPLAGLLAVVWLIGVYAIAAGAMQLVLAGQVRHWVHRMGEPRK